MKYLCAILDDYQGVAMRMGDWTTLASRIDVTVFSKKMIGHQELCRALAPFHIVSLMRERTPFGKELIAALPNLKLIMTTGSQNLSIDIAEANRRNITVCGTSALPRPTVELTFGLMLELARRVGRESVDMKNGKPWQDHVGFDLFGKTLGIIGLGRLGTAVSTIAKAFGMKVIAWSPNLTPNRCDAAGVTFAEKEELLRTSDVVSLHMQLSARTRNLLDSADLALMKRSAFLINTARGELINEQALLDVLRAGGIAGVGLDVYAEEPVLLTHPLRNLTNVVLTPHIGFVTEDNYRTYYGGTVEGIRAWLDQRPVRVLSPV